MKTKQLSTFLIIGSLFLFVASPAFAQSGDVVKVQTFIQSLITILVTLAGFVAALFFVGGGFTYITSSGNPEALDRAKKTIIYAAVGLVIAISALVITNIVTDLAQGAFGGGA